MFMSGKSSICLTQYCTEYFRHWISPFTLVLNFLMTTRPFRILTDKRQRPGPSCNLRRRFSRSFPNFANERGMCQGLLRILRPRRHPGGMQRH